MPLFPGPMLARHRVVLEALGLRAWATRVLLPGAGTSEASAPGPAPAAGLNAWRLFLGHDACALPLRAAVRGGLVPPPGPGGGRLLDEVALREQQRALSALAQLHRITAAALEAGWTVVALKGGATVAAGTMVDLHDLDVLASPADAAALVALLDRLGYAGLGGEGSAHYPARFIPEDVPIEVHRRVTNLPATELLLSRAVPLTSLAGGWRLAPADHLWHLLVHATVQHPTRALRLRDLLVIRAAAADCDAAALADVGARIAASSFAGELEEALRLAAGDRAPSSCLRRRVARRYLLFARRRGPLTLPCLRNRVARLVSSGGVARIVRQDLQRLGVPPQNNAGRRVVRACYAASPSLGRLAHRGARLALLAACAGPAGFIALEERWLAWRGRHSG